MPARKDGMAPRRRHAANVIRGPNRSQAGPATRRTKRLVEVSDCLAVVSYEELTLL